MYFEDELRHRELNEHVLTDTVRIAIGAASVRWLEHGFAGTFARVVPLASRPAGTADPRLDAVIEVRLTSLAHRFAKEVALEFEVRLLDRDGMEIVRWPIAGAYRLDETMRAMSIGEGAAHIGKALAVEKYVGAQVAEAIRQAAAGFLLHFREQPDVRQWLEARGALLPTLPAAGEILVPGPGVAAARAVLILGEPEGFVACLARELGVANIRTVTAAELRDAFYPWLEPPLEASAVAMRFQRLARMPSGAKRLRETGLRHVVVLSRARARSAGGGLLCGSGFGAGGCFGIVWDTHKTSITAGVADLHRDAIATHAVQEEGGLVVPAFILPVPIWWSTEADACADLGKVVLPSIQRIR